MPNEDPSPGHSPPSPHQQRWTIEPDGPDGKVWHFYADGNEKPVDVVPAAAADRLAEVGAKLLKLKGEDTGDPYVTVELGKAWAELRSALSEYHSQKEQR